MLNLHFKGLRNRGFGPFRAPLYIFFLLALGACGPGFQAKSLDPMTGLRTNTFKDKNAKEGRQDSTDITSDTNENELITEKQPHLARYAPEEALGFYAEGTLINSVPLPEKGPGYITNAYQRDFQWGTRNLISVIEYAGAQLYKKYDRNMTVGALSRRTGGSIGHASHQNGLDADISYLTWDPQNLSSLIHNGKLTTNFDYQKNYFLIQTFISTGLVSLVFVSPQVKRALCEYSKSIGLSSDPIQKRIISYKDHDTHMHVRMYCPVTSPKCEGQLEVLSHNGCDE